MERRKIREETENGEDGEENRKWWRDRGRKRREMREKIEEGQRRGETEVRVSRERMRG